MEQLREPAWLTEARQYLGMKEIHGPHHNPRILDLWKAVKVPVGNDEVAWCGAFVGGVLAEVGIHPPAQPGAARSYLSLPVSLDKPAYGCIVVFWRGKRAGWSGHVGFVVGEDKRGNLMVLGGNQGDMVSIKPFDKGRVLGYRWPGIYPYPERFNLPVLTSDGKLSQNEA